MSICIKYRIENKPNCKYLSHQNAIIDLFPILSNNMNLLYNMSCAHKTVGWCYDSWLATTDFNQSFNAFNNVLNTARTEFIFTKERKKPSCFHPSAKVAFLCSEEFMKKSLTSLIYVYRALNRQVVSGAQGALNRST